MRERLLGRVGVVARDDGRAESRVLLTEPSCRASSSSAHSGATEKEGLFRRISCISLSSLISSSEGGVKENMRVRVIYVRLKIKHYIYELHATQ